MRVHVEVPSTSTEYCEVPKIVGSLWVPGSPGPMSLVPWSTVYTYPGFTNATSPLYCYHQQL